VLRCRALRKTCCDYTPVDGMNTNLRLLPGMNRWIGFVGYVGFFLLFSGASFAGDPSGAAMPETLKGIGRAAGTCPIEDGRAKVVPSAEGSQVPADLGCSMNVPDALSQLNQPGTVWVDTRSPADFATYRIDGAINLQASAVRHKAFLRDKTNILVGNGKAERVLYEACSELKKNGFKDVRVLRGGMLSWLLYDQPVIGRRPDGAALWQLNAEELWAEASFDANLVLVSGTRGTIQKRLPRRVLVADAGKETISAALAQRRRSSKKGGGNSAADSTASVVIVPANGLSAEQLSDIRQALKPVPLLVYSDTDEAFERYLAAQESIWKAHAQGPKTPKCGL